MGEWQKMNLGDAPIEIIDGDRGKNYPRKNDFMDSGYCLFLNAKNVTPTGFVFSELNFITRTKDALLRKGKLKKGDLVLTTRGTVGNVAYYNETVPYEHIRINSGMVIIRPTGIDERFNLYLFRSLDEQIKIFTTGTAQPQLPIRDLQTIPIILPPLAEQRAIANVLSSLDDKIDLLHRQNQTLEALAQTLFRQWFIEEADDDWEEISLFEAIVLLGGGTPKTSEERYWNGEIPWLSGSDISANHKSFVNSTTKTISQEGLDHSPTKLLPKFSTVITARGTVGKYCILAKPMAFSQTNYGIMPKFENSFFFTYLLIDHLVEELMSAAYGSVFDTITTRTFMEFQINIPSDHEIMAFEEQVDPYFQKMKVNQDQIQLLKKLRDTLLPKLMSGERRILK